MQTNLASGSRQLLSGALSTTYRLVWSVEIATTLPRSRRRQQRITCPFSTGSSQDLLLSHGMCKAALVPSDLTFALDGDARPRSHPRHPARRRCFELFRFQVSHIVVVDCLASPLVAAAAVPAFFRCRRNTACLHGRRWSATLALGSQATVAARGGALPNRTNASDKMLDDSATSYAFTVVRVSSPSAGGGVGGQLTAQTAGSWTWAPSDPTGARSCFPRVLLFLIRLDLPPPTIPLLPPVEWAEDEPFSSRRWLAGEGGAVLLVMMLLALVVKVPPPPTWAVIYSLERTDGTADARRLRSAITRTITFLGMPSAEFSLPCSRRDAIRRPFGATRLCAPLAHDVDQPLLGMFTAKLSHLGSR